MWDWIPSLKIFSLSTYRFGINPIFNYAYQKPHLHVNSGVFISMRLCVHADIYLHPTQKLIQSFQSLEMLTKTQHYPNRMQIFSSLELNDASSEYNRLKPLQLFRYLICILTVSTPLDSDGAPGCQFSGFWHSRKRTLALFSSQKWH